MTLEEIIPSDYSIGIHGISGENPLEKAKQILENGIKINGWGGILSTAQMHSVLSLLSPEERKSIKEYRYSFDSNGNWANIIVAVPETIKIIDDTYFLGHYNNCSHSFQKGDDKSGAYLPVTKYTAAIGMVPKEFIVGIAYGNLNSGAINFIPNSEFIAKKTLEDQLLLIEQMKAAGVSIFTIEQWRKVIDSPMVQASIQNGNEYYVQVNEYLSKGAAQKS